MLIPLFLTLFSHHPLAPRPHISRHKAAAQHTNARHTNARHAKQVRTAVKGDIQSVMLAPSPRFDHLASSGYDRPASRRLFPPRWLMPMTASLRLDTRAQEEEQEEACLVAAINNERTQRGLASLTEDPLLDVTARIHSREMCSLSYFDHHSPTAGSRTPMDRYLAGLRAWGEDKPESALIGENIFYASATDSVYNASYAHMSLMNSPGHRANILEPRFTKIGVGLYRDSQNRFWVTETFLRDIE